MRDESQVAEGGEGLLEVPAQPDTGVDIMAHAPMFIVETNKEFQRSLEGY